MRSVFASTRAMRFRWVNAQCFEFVLSNGKTLLTDPYFDDPERFREIQPNILIRNKRGSSRDFDRVAERFADIFARSNTQLLIPMHCETWANECPEFLDSVITDMNQIMADKGLIGRVALLERTKWYGLDLTITAL